ncbi:MAG: hypothetical protein LBF22_03915 [Deltaproteobacteria bacterium]|nr:hypothetical protein [Deltaproteobacteria bacterium]
MSSKTNQARDSLEKVLSYLLGVAPEEYGLVPREDGFYPVKEVVGALQEDFRGLNLNRIKEVINLAYPNSPFELVDNLIRLKGEPKEFQPPTGLAPPKELFIGLKPSNWKAAHIHGLTPRKPVEHQLRLFSSKELATQVAQRSSNEFCLIKVLVNKAQLAGQVFTPFSEKIWHTDFLKPEFLVGPPVKTEEEREPSQKEMPKLPIPQAPTVHQGKKKGKYGDSPEWKNQTRRDRRSHKDS